MRKIYWLYWRPLWHARDWIGTPQLLLFLKTSAFSLCSWHDDMSNISHKIASFLTSQFLARLDCSFAFALQHGNCSKHLSPNFASTIQSKQKFYTGHPNFEYRSSHVQSKSEGFNFLIFQGISNYWGVCDFSILVWLLPSCNFPEIWEPISHIV